MNLTDKHIQSIEAFSLFGMQSGLPKSTAKVLGFLLICQPTAQSAAQIRATLQLSLGSVSNALQTLTDMGVVSQAISLGERSTFYEIRPAGMVHAVKQKLQTFEQAKSIARAALDIDPQNVRLKTFYDVYETIGTELLAAVNHLEQRSKDSTDSP